MPYQVKLTHDAARDLEEISHYIDRHDSLARADHVLRRIERAFQGLSEHPHRGNCSISGYGSTGRFFSNPTESSIG